MRSVSRERSGAGKTSRRDQHRTRRHGPGGTDSGTYPVVHLHCDVGRLHDQSVCSIDRCKRQIAGCATWGPLLLRPGTYQVRAEKAGFSPAEQKIVVTEAPNQSFALTLSKLPGYCACRSRAAATVTIDGKPVGNAPGEFKVAPGKHQIAIDAQRYQPFTGEVEIEGLGKLQAFAPTLVPAWANVSVTSEPPGAEVLVSGEKRGVTPLTAEVMAGSRPVELRLEGFKPWTTDVQVKANEPLSLGPVKLGLPDGRLALRSDPPGASVSVGGVYRGQTPVELELRPDIAHAVVLTRAGFEPVTRDVSLSAGERRALSVPLAGIYGEIAVRAQPADAQIYRRRASLSGPVNQTLRLVAATHEIEIRKAGYRGFQDQRDAATRSRTSDRDDAADA